MSQLLTLGTELELKMTCTKLRSSVLKTQESKGQVAQVLRRPLKICVELSVIAGSLVSAALPPEPCPHFIISLRRPKVSWG